jgi:aminopeptidase N
MRTWWAPLLALLVCAPAEAQRLPTIVRPEHYDLAIDVDLAHARFSGTERIRVRLSEPSARIVLHAVDLEFQDVSIASAGTVRGARVVLDKTTETATLAADSPIPAGAADIHVRYSAPLNRDLRGFYLSEANGRSYAVTQFESTDARRAFPSFDEPALKATFAVKLTIDRGDTAISNGRLTADTPAPDPSKHTLTFATTPKMSTYLVAMAVGDFDCLEGAADGVPIRVCATPDKKHLGGLALQMAGEAISFYNRYYAIKYPFGKLDMVAIPDFAAGAMENTGAIFYRETALLADAATASLASRKYIATVIAHEIAHQWFGDLVTMRWWDDLWLNEGFATWMERRPFIGAHPDWQMDVDETADNQTALNLDALSTTRPIHSNAESPAEIEETFDAIAYQKGAAVLRMVERYVGEDDFRKGINAYLARHAYANATSEDFWRAIATASRKPVDRILPTFVNQPGVPLLDVSLECTPSGHALTIKQERLSLNPAAPAFPARWQIPICRKQAGVFGASCTELRVESATLIGEACPSWVFLNAGAQGYYRTAYAPSMLRALAPDVETRLTAPERLSLVGDEWALVRAGRHSVADYLTLASGFGRESTSVVLGEIAGRLDFIRSNVAGGRERPRLEAFVRSLLRPLFDDLGLEPTGADTEDRRALRAVVANSLGTVGNDDGVASEARVLVDQALAGARPLDSTMAASLLNIAARKGDVALYDGIVAAATQAKTPEDYYRYLSALGRFEDPVLVERGLERVLSADVRSQDTVRHLSGYFANPNEAVRQRAWTFLKEHWTDLERKLSIAGADASLTGILASFCDAGTRDDVKAFFAARPRPTAARALNQTLERIDNCIALRDKQGPALAAWLSAQPGGRE